MRERNEGRWVFFGRWGLCWVFTAALGLSLVVASRGYSSLQREGIPLWCCLWLLSTGSRCTASVLVAHEVSSCDAQAQLPHGMWNPPGPGMEPMSLALAGGFLATGPPRKCREMVFWFGYPQKQTLRQGFETNSPFSS